LSLIFAGTLTKNEMTVTHLYALDDLVDLTPATTGSSCCLSFAGNAQGGAHR
jgi:magnesium-transporting ATPase (P-type)